MYKEQQTYLPNYQPTDLEIVRAMNLQDRVSRAIKLLKDNEPTNGYHVAFSGGKDSCVIKKLSQMAVVKFVAKYSQTTIDPPELVRFIKTFHSDVAWEIPKHGNMMHRVATINKAPPTRTIRWCCDEYKENAVVAEGMMLMVGVRAAESKRREIMWREVTQHTRNGAVMCPIVYWSDEQLWEFIRHYGVPYCSLYDEGWTRLGCVGCPLNNGSRLKEFKRWPKFKDNWKKAISENWRRLKDIPRLDGQPRMHSRFKTAKEFWEWWMQEHPGDIVREECQTTLLMTNQELDENENQ